MAVGRVPVLAVQPGLWRFDALEQPGVDGRPDELRDGVQMGTTYAVQDAGHDGASCAELARSLSTGRPSRQGSSFSREHRWPPFAGCGKAHSSIRATMSVVIGWFSPVGARSLSRPAHGSERATSGRGSRSSRSPTPACLRHVAAWFRPGRTIRRLKGQTAMLRWWIPSSRG